METSAAVLPLAAPGPVACPRIPLETLDPSCTPGPRSGVRGLLLTIVAATGLAAGLFALGQRGPVDRALGLEPDSPQVLAEAGRAVPRAPITAALVPFAEPAADGLIPLDVPQRAGAQAPAPQALPSAPAAASEPIYIDVGPRIPEDFSFEDEVVFACVFGTPADAYPVAGDSIDVIVDGRPLRLAYEPSAVYTGAKKVVLRVPGMLTPHTVVFKPVYDLGPDGTVPVGIVSSSDGLGGHTSWYQSPVQRLEASGQPGRLRVK